MNASVWIELGGLIVTLLGGGTVGVSKMTRIAVAAENLAEQIAALAAAHSKTVEMVQNHENRLNRANLLFPHAQPGSLSCSAAPSA